MERNVYGEVLQRTELLRRSYETRELGILSYGSRSYPLYAFLSNRKEGLPHIYIQGGLHGNEPAPIHALLEVLENHELSKYPFSFCTLPLLNPYGFVHNTRLNGEGLDPNRSFSREDTHTQESSLLMNFLEKRPLSYLAAFDLHEDPTDQVVEGFKQEENPTAFYVYEKKPRHKTSLATKVTKELKTLGVRIWDKDHVYDKSCLEGVVSEGYTGESSAGNNFGDFIGAKAHYVLSPETPTLWPLVERIRVHKLFLEKALDLLASGEL